ncbi:uncharacterized protein EI90DRAFT_3011281 [Cantharellus anzutake]|uniref:uncharacterized protein n=1 Tax=Cantharellus anzutake TaxID=1750568 RepID=UPI001906C6C1|nr:uncharacterized protein EI90DRAFT_3011281 [Cantharellus anzutake]KAF8342813.1 hypothetical protein EI90DRAFT_3011281 [Cantharellus anzutake]
MTEQVEAEEKKKKRAELRTGVDVTWNPPADDVAGDARTDQGRIDEVDVEAANLLPPLIDNRNGEEDLPRAKPFGAAMIMCTLQMGARVLAQCIGYHESFGRDFLIVTLSSGLQQRLFRTSAAVLQLVRLTLHYMMFGKTLRQAYEVECLVPCTDLGTKLPRISLLATIAIAYSIIATIICGFSFGLLWFAWKFLFIWVMDQQRREDYSASY